MNLLAETLSEGLKEWEWLGILAARIAVGLLFFVSGIGKLVSDRKQTEMRKTVQEAGIPWPHFTAVFVAFCEMLFGAMLMAGIFMPLACVVLMVIMIVAIVTVQAPEWQGDPGDWIAKFLYLPETLYLVILFWLLLSGPGWFSVEHALQVEYGAPAFTVPGEETMTKGYLQVSAFGFPFSVFSGSVVPL